jgi:hypothetical protein
MRPTFFWPALLSTVLFLGGCETMSGGSPDAKEFWLQGDPSTLRSRTFEIPIAAAEQIPDACRRPAVPADYQVAVMPQDQLERLAGQMRADTGLLSDVTRQIPGGTTADSWSYLSRPERMLAGPTGTGTGSGSGSFAVRHDNAGREVLVDYDMFHSIGAKVDARAYYRGPLAEGSALVFYKPFTRDDGIALAHVVAFEVSAAK